ncbi:hypothetical protein D8865_09135 [Streptococcus mitis]|jgi:hypothetical protein|uniref:Uncharacterized protein n=1 Tax=Streptococcus mitis TaxID=28037 RepID=A0A3R9PEL1_STRMT|nr:hypothetical protein [Streptococcus mitis]RSI59626.1 hypothetical protein D8865_09135 [Streptococcus mitis]
MLPLKLIHKSHPNATYATQDNKRIRDIVIADKNDTDEFWFDYNKKDEFHLEFIPRNLVAEINELAKPSITDKRPQVYLDNIARSKVIPTLIESVIESMPTPHETDESKIEFIDYLVLVPLNQVYSELKIYVPSNKAGMTRLPRTNVRDMVGRYVSCKIVNLKRCILPHSYDTKTIWNNYYAEGSIERAEQLACADIKSTIAEVQRGEVKNSVVLNQRVVERLKEERASLLSSIFNGVIAQTSNRGIYVICTEKDYHYFTVYIPRGRISYLYESIVPSSTSKFKVGEQIRFKLVEEQTYLEGKGLENQILADSKCLETPPREQILKLIDENKLVGSTHKAYVVAYDITRGHRIELEDIPGAIVKLNSDARITPDFVLKRTPIFVKVDRARRFPGPEDDQRYTVYCSYISDASSKEKAVSAFEF